MKTLLDRLNPLYSSDYNFRDIYLIATAADDGDATFDKARLKGIIACGGVDEASSINNFVDIKNKAYELGKNL